MTRVRDLDESQLIAHFRRLLPTGDRTLLGSGDDCALVAAPEGSFLVTTDVLVEGRHFDPRWSSPDQIGERAAAQNLADVAAMGGRTSSMVVSLVLPGHTDLDWLLALVAGFGERARRAGAGVVGGDLSSGDSLVISVTAMGWVDGAPLTRSGAQPGDMLAVAGTLGRSAAGLALLQGGYVDPVVRDDVVLDDLAEALRIHRAPEPPLEAGPVAAARGAHAMMDISDGLAVDGRRMALASGVVVEVDPLLLAPDVSALRGPGRVCSVDPMTWVLHGGEDHALLAAFPPEAVLPAPFRQIGWVGAAGPGLAPCCRVGGTEVRGGWDHFTGGS
ncbi:thiamine-phosphate kinase [Schaalia sp. 19OD2882]|uniref:thiamine-phosphate kinase n=1 Tax=Schaalia sp. 19OD2882 TaxID=2794089 RepID=UPI001C1EAA16|nr:thiamine-phosphate kinase [Schaalia sp. 19OD2882]QWW18912.1 thiamine-phosphate kinase [Schaalia sp. 19OD2882]